MGKQSAIARLRRPTTAIVAIAWIVVSVYLSVAWPSLSALLEMLGSVPPDAAWMLRLPRMAFAVIGLVAALILSVKDRWTSTVTALAINAAIGAPAFALIALWLQPFLVPLE